MSITKHPLDDPEFREWMEETAVLLDCFSYGIYDSKWTELYETFKEETEDEREACTSECDS